MSFACVLHLAMSSCALHHHVFSKLASVPVSSFLPLSVLSPDTLARARGMSGLLFYKWPEKCSRNGWKVGMRCRYVVGRPPAKFHRIRSLFDAPTDNYSGSIASLMSDVFGLRKQSPGLPLFSFLSSRPSTQLTTYHQVQPNLSRQPAAPLARVRNLSRTRPGQSLPLCPDQPQTSTKRLCFVNWTS